MDVLLSTLLVIIIPIFFIAFFLAAPFWMAYLTKNKQDETLLVSRKTQPKEIEKFIKSQKKEKSFKEYKKYLYGGGICLFMVIASILTGELSYPGKNSIVIHSEDPDTFYVFTGITFVLGVWLIGYALINKWKNNCIKNLNNQDQ